MAVHRINWDEPAPEVCRGGIVTVGNFDGVHRAHAALLALTATRAAEAQVPAVVLTFDPHPLKLLRPEWYQPTLTTLEDRARLLHEAGANHVAILHTRPELLRLSAADFFRRVIRGNLDAAGMVEGPNFAFGHNREGTVEMLARFCAEAGMSLEVAPPLMLEGALVSTSRVRQALVAGDVESAARWLGRPYRIRGQVSTGERRGATLGFPTANLSEVPTLIPGDGVYAVRVFLLSTSSSEGSEIVAWPGACNVGPNPTFETLTRKLEVHLIGFEGDLYGQSLEVDFVAKLRETQKFESIDALRRQIAADVAQARELAADPAGSRTRPRA